MGKPKKYSHLKNVPLKVYIKFLEYLDCQHIRTTGGHYHYARKDLDRPLTLQSHIDPVPEFIIRNHLRIIGISKNECLEILGKVG